MLNSFDFIRWCSLESVEFEKLVVVDVYSDFDFDSFFGALPDQVLPEGLCVAIYSDLDLHPYGEFHGIKVHAMPDAVISLPDGSIELFHIC